MDNWLRLSFSLRLTLLLIALVFVTVIASSARALEPGWYAPLDGSGQALHVRCNDADACAVVWETYTEQHGQVFLVSEGLCGRAEAECEEALSRTIGSFAGIGRDAEILEPEVFIGMTQDSDGLLLEWDARALRPEICSGVTAGGLLFRGCINTSGKRFFLLAE